MWDERPRLSALVSEVCEASTRSNQRNHGHAPLQESQTSPVPARQDEGGTHCRARHELASSTAAGDWEVVAAAVLPLPRLELQQAPLRAWHWQAVGAVPGLVARSVKGLAVSRYRGSGANGAPSGRAPQTGMVAAAACRSRVAHPGPLQWAPWASMPDPACACDNRG